MAKKPYIISTFSGKKGELPSARLVGSHNGGGGGSVTSVNGKTGAVTLTAADLDDSFKDALLDCFENAAWKDTDGREYVNALEAALYPPADLLSISAVFEQGETVIYDTDSLDALKPMLTVTANYDNGTSRTVTDYTLSGTLTEGTSTITVSYGDKTATFDVVVSAPQVLVGYDSVGTPTITDNVFTPSASGYIKTPDVFSPGDSAWAIRTKIVASSDGTKYQNLLRSVNSSNEGQKGVVLQKTQVSSGEHSISASSDNSNYDISNVQTFYLSGTVFLEISFDGVQTYTVKSSSDGESWNTLKTITSTKKVIGGYAIALGGPIPSAQFGPYRGNIYLDDTKIYIGGQLWWKAVA